MDHLFQGVLFSEGWPPKCEKIRETSVTLDDQYFGGSQLKNLTDVKAELVKLVKANGGNALIEFTYGQKAVGFWASLLSIDNVSWWGKGTIARQRKGLD